MKTFAFAVLCSAAMLAAVNGNPGSIRHGPADDAPGMEGCNSDTVSSSSSSSPNNYGDVVVPRTMTLRQCIRFNQPTFIDVDEDTVFVSDKAIDTTNLYFSVHKGATLTFRAPAVIITRHETSVRPLFDLSGTVVFEATGSVPVLLDGSRVTAWFDASVTDGRVQVDERGLVGVQDSDAVFMSGRDDIVRYHPSGVTVLKRAGAGDPVPTRTGAWRVVDIDVGSQVCLLTAYYFDTPEVPGSCPSPTLSPAITVMTATSPGHHEDGTYANARTDGNGVTSRNTGTTTGTRTRTTTGTSAGTSTNTRTDTSTGSSPGASTGTSAGGSRNSGIKCMDHEHEHCLDGRNNDPERGAGKRVITVGDTLTGPLVSPNGQSALRDAKIGSIVFAKESATSPDASGHASTGGVRLSILVAAHVGSVERVVQTRDAVLTEMREGGVGSRESRSSRRGIWGWVPFRIQHQKDVGRARGHMGEVDMTLTDRPCVEVSVDGICVLSKSGRFKRELMNRFPWRRRKNNDYELHVTDDGMEVRFGKGTIWGVTAKDMMD